MKQQFVSLPDNSYFSLFDKTESLWIQILRCHIGQFANDSYADMFDGL